jgi:hypothetical protein
MKPMFFTIALLTPFAVSAQAINPWIPIMQNPQYSVPIVPVVPVVPVVPRQLPPNPWGTGYSVVTTTRTKPDLFRQAMGERGATMEETTTQAVPNDAGGNPMKSSPFLP